MEEQEKVSIKLNTIRVQLAHSKNKLRSLEIERDKLIERLRVVNLSIIDQHVDVNELELQLATAKQRMEDLVNE